MYGMFYEAHGVGAITQTSVGNLGLLYVWFVFMKHMVLVTMTQTSVKNVLYTSYVLMKHMVLVQ